MRHRWERKPRLRESEWLRAACVNCGCCRVKMRSGRLRWSYYMPGPNPVLERAPKCLGGRRGASGVGGQSSG